MAHWTEAVKKLEALKREVPVIAGNEMVNFALDNIKNESWEGRPYKKRKPGSKRDSGRKLLVDTGRGRRSIDDKITGTRVSLTAIDYMVAHNEGVNKTVSARSRKGKSYSRKMNLPQRQFTGESRSQTERIEKVIQQRIIQALT